MTMSNPRMRVSAIPRELVVGSLHPSLMTPCPSCSRLSVVMRHVSEYPFQQFPSANVGYSVVHITQYFLKVQNSAEHFDPKVIRKNP